MPWLYSGPSDNLCQLRGVEEDHGESIHGGGEEEGGETGKFWDGSRDRWVSVVSTRVNPDAVTNQLGLLPRHEVQVPPEDVDAESEANAKMVREYLEWEQAMAGEKDENPWSWVRKRLIGVRGYKPWFGHLFTKDQQEMRYRDIHADLRAVREHAEKEAKEKVKEARAGVAASGAGGTASSSKGKGRAEKERPGYADMDPMRRAHLFGVGIKAHVVSPWATHTDQDEPTRAAAAETLAAAAAPQGHASGEPCSSGAQVAGGCSETIAHPASAAAVGAGKGGSKKRPALGVTSLRKAQKVASTSGKQKEASGKGSRGPRDRAWIRFQVMFASTELSEVALRIKYEEACRQGTVTAMLDGKMHVPVAHGVAAAVAAAAAAAAAEALQKGASLGIQGGGEAAIYYSRAPVVRKAGAGGVVGGSSDGAFDPIQVFRPISLAEKLKARARGHDGHSASPSPSAMSAAHQATVYSPGIGPALSSYPHTHCHASTLSGGGEQEEGADGRKGCGVETAETVAHTRCSRAVDEQEGVEHAAKRHRQLHVEAGNGSNGNKSKAAGTGQHPFALSHGPFAVVHGVLPAGNGFKAANGAVHQDDSSHRAS